MNADHATKMMQAMAAALAPFNPTPPMTAIAIVMLVKSVDAKYSPGFTKLVKELLERNKS